MGDAEEKVLVIPSRVLAEHNIGHGLYQCVPCMNRPFVSYGMLACDILDREITQVMPRSAHENDEQFRAICVYVVIRHDGWFYSYRRTGASDPRLLGNHSIGVGGHVTDRDIYAVDNMSGVLAAAIRETEEEIQLDDLTPENFNVVGLINDTATPVGRVHLGVVFGYESLSMDIKIRETSALQNGEWVSESHLLKNIERYESWSKILIKSDQVDRLAARR